MMTTDKPETTVNYKGAWLTDIDDTLLPSGAKPEDEWMQSLAKFIKVLKQHNVLWVPVSGVALAKMGPRMLYRLPEEVLSHVLYYGGEGSTKSYYDVASKSWKNTESFQRNFNDAQSVALIGENRLAHALAAIYQTGQQDERIVQRIHDANTVLEKASFDHVCMIDEMEHILAEHGYDRNQAETYYRGGALSWMMLGDKSVDLYRGMQETEVRMKIRDFAQSWLEKHNHLRDLGMPGVGMPYKHATRGIKVVLEGNDKGRAAEDLINNYHIPAPAILFTGNELFDGGNDNSVRRVSGVRIISVGEKEDPGVINGGVQVGANKNWMQWITEHRLQLGHSWDSSMEELPAQAEKLSLTQLVDGEKQRPSKLSELHNKYSQYITSEQLAEITLRHRPALENTRHALVTLRNLEYKLLARLATLPKYHYDEARKIVMALVDENIHEKSDNASYFMANKIKGLLLPELKEILRKTYIGQLNVPIRVINTYIRNIRKLEDVLPELDKLFIMTPLLDYSAEKTRAGTLVNNWENRIESFAEDWFSAQRNWQLKKTAEQADLFNDKLMSRLTDNFPEHEIYYYFCRIVPRLFNFPHLKDLDKPTIVLVAGTSGVGKSTISQHISKTLGISTYFSTDVTSRSVMREAFKYIVGDEGATHTFPELYGSSFDNDNLEWFYAQSLLTTKGTAGSIERLVKENVSAVIDGVSLIPGTLDDKYFEIANIVWIVACIENEEVHYQRMGTRDETGVSRGGAERYREKIRVIRNNHDRLVAMGKRAGAYIADNSDSLSQTLGQILSHIKTPFSDRGLPIADSIRDKLQKSLVKRVSQAYKRHQH